MCGQLEGDGLFTRRFSLKTIGPRGALELGTGWSWRLENRYPASQTHKTVITASATVVSVDETHVTFGVYVCVFVVGFSGLVVENGASRMTMAETKMVDCV